MMGPDDFEMVASICAARAGLRVDTAKTYLIESRLASVARRENFGSLAEFAVALRRGGEERLIQAAVEAMAQVETGFFRDPATFDRIVHELLPGMLRERQAPIRVWVAACGAGQEVYSLAMALAEDPALAQRVELFASDLSQRNLDKAQAGLYSQFEVQSGLSARRLVRHFEKDGELFALSPRIRQLVRWRRLNLVEPPPKFRPFDVVLCRQLLPRLTQQGQRQALENLSSALAHDGRIVLGRGESPAAAPALVPSYPAMEIFELRADIRTAA